MAKIKSAFHDEIETALEEWARIQQDRAAEGVPPETQTRLAEEFYEHAIRRSKVQIIRDVEKVLFEKIPIAVRDDRGVLVPIRNRRRKLDSAPKGMRCLALWSDWAPTPASRKWLKKLIADQAQHELELRKADRVWAARWIVMATFVLGVTYVLRAPFAAVLSVVRKSSGAS